MRADEVYAILKGKLVKLTEDIKSMRDWKPIQHKGTVQTADDLPTDAKEGWMYNIATDSIYGAAGMNVVMTSEGWDPMGPIINMGPYLTKEEGNKTFQPKGNYLSGTDSDLKESGKAADAKVTGEKIAKNSSDITKKLDKNQGVENSGKIAGINESGDIVPIFPVGVEYNSETKCLEFGSDQKMKLNQGIGLDSTLTKTGSAADAGATGKEINSLKEDLISKADKTALVKTDRKLDALWKLNQGISYEFQTDDTEAYQKTVPSGAKVANVKSIGGKTIVWNQLNLNSEKSATKDGISFINNKDGSWTITGTCSASDDESANIPIHAFAEQFVSGHKYLVKADKYFGENYGFAINGTSTPLKKAAIVDYAFNPIIFVKDKVTVDNVTMRMNLFDLTQMFGSGNEPSTPEEFEAMFSADYYPYNAGELMSAPVNEVVEQGRNLFDCYGFSCTNIPNIAAKRDIANGYGTTISTIDPTNRLIVTQNKADGSSKHDFRNGYFCIGIRGLKYNTNYISAFDFTPTKILIVDPIMKLLVNGKPDFGGSVSDFTLNVKKHVTIKFVYNANNDAQFLELRNSGMSGIIENFQIEEGTTVATYSPYHKTSYPIPQAILNLPGYGWSAGDVRNEVNWENKQYHKRVGKVDLGTLEYRYDPNNIRFIAGLADVLTKDKNDKINCISTFYTAASGDIFDNSKETDLIIRVDENVNQIYIRNLSYADATTFKNAMSGVILYYELAEEQITDISNLIGDTLQEPIEVEAGGTLTFKNSNGDNYRIPVSSSEEYLVSLAEVAK